MRVKKLKEKKNALKQAVNLSQCGRGKMAEMGNPDVGRFDGNMTRCKVVTWRRDSAKTQTHSTLLFNSQLTRRVNAHVL